jgi:hypothetical protein
MKAVQHMLINSGQTLSATARSIGVSLQDLSHFVRGERDKVGRARRKKIREWMVGQGLIKPIRKPEVCVCPLCQGKHVKRKNVSRRSDHLAVEGETIR